jgi:hypothetical protein
LIFSPLIRASSMSPFCIHKSISSGGRSPNRGCLSAFSWWWSNPPTSSGNLLLS